MARGGFHRLLREDGGATVHAFEKCFQNPAKVIPNESSCNVGSKYIIISHQFIMYKSNRAKTFWCKNFQSHISHSIMHQFTRFFHQNHQEHKIYKNMAMNLRIKRFENWTSWRAVLEFARSTACNDPNPVQNACDDVWWRKGSLKTCRSSLILNFHLWVFELQLLDSCTNSSNKHLIHTLFNSLIMNLQQKQGVMLKKFEFWFEENFGGRWKLDLEMVNCD